MEKGFYSDARETCVNGKESRHWGLSHGLLLSRVDERVTQQRRHSRGYLGKEDLDVYDRNKKRIE